MEQLGSHGVAENLCAPGDVDNPPCLDLPEPTTHGEELASAVVRQVMEGAAAPAVQLSVPLVADAGTGATWAEAH